MNITRKAIYVLSLILATSFVSNAQIAINEDGSSPDASAMLDVTSTSKGILVPRMTTTQRTAISSPATGLLVYDTDFNTFWYYANSAWNNISSAVLADADADTKIQVEESSDEDIIRFDLGGTEFLKLENGRIAPQNTGFSVFLGDESGENDDFTNNYNTFVGHATGKVNTSGEGNVFVGAFTGYKNTTGKENTFIGDFSGTNNITGSYNIFLGSGSGTSETGSNKLYIENSSADSDNALIYGEFDNNLLQINGTLNIGGNYAFPTADGSASQILKTDGSGTLSWSDLDNTSLSDADADTKIQVEESSDEDIIRFDLGGTEYFKFGNGRIEVLNTGWSVFLGEGAGGNDNLSDNRNTFIGYHAGSTLTTGNRNVFLGNNSGRDATSGYYNTYLGFRAGVKNTTGYDNVMIGYDSGFDNLTGYSNVFLGNEAGHENETGHSNVFLGNEAGYNETGSNKLYIENSDSTSPLIYGEFDNNLIEINGTLSVTDGFVDADADTKIQVEESSNEDIIRFDLGGTEHFTMNSGRLNVLNTGSSVFMGEGAGENDDLSDNQNVAIGYNALQTNTTGLHSVAIGTNAGNALTSSFNVFVGSFTGQNIVNDTKNVIVGGFAGDDLSLGGGNTFLGYNAGGSISTGSDNVFLGQSAGGNSSSVSDRLFIANSNRNDPLIYGEFDNDLLVFNGEVGIGVSPTKAMFEIDGSGSTQSFTSTHGILAASGAGTNSSNSVNLSIYANANIAATSYIAFSDARIKEIQGVSNGKKDLNTLMNIEITDYTMKDTIQKGNQSIKKVIAQQVAEVYPQAVNTNLTDIIPNIYQTATIQNGWVSFNPETSPRCRDAAGQVEKWTIDNGQLKKGDRVQIIFDDKKEVLEVLETKENAFRVETLHCNVCTEESTVFVYGKQVDDFHTVDYEAISMLNVSATQQLVKEVKQLQKENQLLKAQVEKINQLEAMLLELQGEKTASAK